MNTQTERRLITIAVESEEDIVAARQVTRHIAVGLGFGGADQTRTCTAMSEIARNAVCHAGGGRVSISLEREASEDVLVIQVSDEGPGFDLSAARLLHRGRISGGAGAQNGTPPRLGMSGARRLADEMLVETSPAGTTVTLRKQFPAGNGRLDDATIGRVLDELTRRRRADPVDEFRHQNRELLAALTDLTERNRELAMVNAELDEARASAESRARAARALEHIAEGVLLVIEPEGNIGLCNKAAAGILGVNEDDLLGAHLSTVVPGWESVEESLDTADVDRGAASEVIRGQCRIQLAGETAWLAVSRVLLPEYRIFTFRDVTRDHAVERLKADFVATVSHELRTPLTAIKGSAITLERTDIDLADDVRRELLFNVVDQAQRLERIVHDLLTATSFDSDTRRRPAMEQMDVGDVVAASLESFRFPPALEVRRSGMEQAHAAQGDPQAFRQVLDNVLENAVKYSPGSGLLEVGVYRTAAGIAVRVRDHGIGIPFDEHQRVFERFYRADPGMMKGVGGTGLGLFISRELMRSMGGELSMQSSPGQGSTFSLELPLDG